MFGYVRPLTAELKVGEYQYYKAVYCGVCKAMGGECGWISRTFLSYDLTFLALLLSAVNGERTEIGQGRCPANPLAKRPMIRGSVFTDYAAAVCGALAAYRFRDDRADERGVRKALASLGTSVSAKWIARVRENYPGLCEGIEEKLDALSAAESSYTEETVSIDAPAGLFGDLLAFVCAYPFARSDAPDAAQRKVICASVGRHVGRWIYCVDALDDLADDAKHGRFNPFLLAYGRAELTEEEKTTLSCLLDAEAGEASLALELRENFADASHEPMKIVENVLTLGMDDVAGKVLKGTYRKPGKDRI